jgi:hypothetical protein
VSNVRVLKPVVWNYSWSSVPFDEAGECVAHHPARGFAPGDELITLKRRVEKLLRVPW